MQFRIIKKQENSRYCAVCGIENPFSFNARYYETESNEALAVFKTRQMQQSFPGRVHGGVISALLDETIGRAIWITDPEVWAVTVELDLRYRKPVPLETSMICVGRITRNSKKIFEGIGEIYLPDGTLAIEAKGKYWKMKGQEVDVDIMKDEGWWVLEEKDPRIVEVGQEGLKLIY